MKRIENIEQFRLERDRLKNLKTFQEAEMKNAYQGFTATLKPGKLLNEAVQSMITDKTTTKSLVAHTGEMVLNILVNKFLYKGNTSPGIIKTAGTYLLQGLAEKYLSNKSGTIVEFIMEKLNLSKVDKGQKYHAPVKPYDDMAK